MVKMYHFNWSKISFWSYKIELVLLIIQHEKVVKLLYYITTSSLWDHVSIHFVYFPVIWTVQFNVYQFHIIQYDGHLVKVTDIWPQAWHHQKWVEYPLPTSSIFFKCKISTQDWRRGGGSVTDQFVISVQAVLPHKSYSHNVAGKLLKVIIITNNPHSNIIKQIFRINLNFDKKKLIDSDFNIIILIKDKILYFYL